MFFKNNRLFFEIEHDHFDNEELIVSILQIIATEEKKSIEKIKKLLLIKQDNAIGTRFWKILDELLPDHSYNYVGCCAECGSLELRKQLP